MGLLRVVKAEFPNLGKPSCVFSMPWNVLAAFLFLSASVAAQSPLGEPLPTRWRGPGRQPLAPVCPSQAFSVQEVARSAPFRLLSHEPGRPTTGRVAVVVATNIYAAVSNAVRVYTGDLSSNGFSTITFTFSGTAEQLRLALSNYYYGAESLRGAVLVGELPYAVWEMLKSFDGSSTNYAADVADIFFMDLDGGWLDTNSTSPFAAGKYDARTGDKKLEIWVSRLRGRGITAATGAYTNEVTVLTNYFQRLHRYRVTNMVMRKGGLTYTDNDWNSHKDSDQLEMQACYPTDVISRAVGVDTNASGTEFRDAYMTQNVEMIQLRCHGNSQAQTFDDGTVISYATWTNKDPRAVFYNIYGCSAGNYLSDNNVARMVIFNKDANGLVSWSNSGEGGMIAFMNYRTRVFFNTMGEGETVGEAFRRWYNGCVDGDSDTYEQYWMTPKWWNGMILNGDGALTVRTPHYVYVAPNGGGVAPYSTWTDAATNIHSAFESASAGDTIVVADGRYSVTNVLRFRSSKAITMRGSNGLWGAILDGSLSTGGVFRIDSGVGAVVEDLAICNGRAFGGNYGGGARMDGGLVRRCLFTNNIVCGYGAGGAIYCQGACQIEECTFAGNMVSNSGGGGVQILSSGVTIYDCLFTNNVAQFGGAVAMVSSVNVVRCQLLNNRATGTSGGGGVYCAADGAQVWNCEIRGNVSHYDGGGLFLYRGTVGNSLVIDNAASNRGGGICSEGYTNTAKLGTFIQNCTISGNSGKGQGCGVVAVKYTYLLNDIVSGNGTDDWYNAGGNEVCADYSCFGEVVAGTSNLNTAPLFVGGGDYRLRSGSPCIDAGTGLVWHALAYDLADLPRVVGAAADLGAYEFQGAADPDSDDDGMPDWWETRYGLNPTNAADAEGHADDDGIANRCEYIMDTDPTNAESCLRIDTVAWTNLARVTFACSTARLYSLEFTTGNPTGPWAQVEGQTNIAGPVSGTLTLSDTNAAPVELYRIDVRVP